jgi:hypothetical protein
MTLTLRIHVKYDSRRHEPELIRQLHAAAEHLLDNGLLTGNTEAEVVECTHDVSFTLHPCPCGSGLESEWEYDARGIELGRMCPVCKPERLYKFRPEVLSDSNYTADEPIEED